VGGNCGDHCFRFGRLGNTIQSQEDDSRIDATKPEHEFPKVLVFSHERGGLVRGVLQDKVIAGASGRLRNRQDIVSLLAESPDNQTVHALVRDEVHATFPGPG
jgi:hypothetical protein